MQCGLEKVGRVNDQLDLDYSSSCEVLLVKARDTQLVMQELKTGSRYPRTCHGGLASEHASSCVMLHANIKLLPRLVI